MARTSSPAHEDRALPRLTLENIDKRLRFWVKSSRLGADDDESGPHIQNVTIEACPLRRVIYRSRNGRSRGEQFLARDRATRAGIAASAVLRQDRAVGN